MFSDKVRRQVWVSAVTSQPISIREQERKDSLRGLGQLLSMRLVPARH